MPLEKTQHCIWASWLYQTWQKWPWGRVSRRHWSTCAVTTAAPLCCGHNPPTVLTWALVGWGWLSQRAVQRDVSWFTHFQVTPHVAGVTQGVSSRSGLAPNLNLYPGCGREKTRVCQGLRSRRKTCLPSYDWGAGVISYFKVSLRERRKTGSEAHVENVLGLCMLEHVNRGSEVDRCLLKFDRSHLQVHRWRATLCAPRFALKLPVVLTQQRPNLLSVWKPHCYSWLTDSILSNKMTTSNLFYGKLHFLAYKCKYLKW